MNAMRNRRTENVVYLSLWITALGIYTLDIMRGRAELSLPLLDLHLVTRMLKTIIPFFLLFFINNYLLIPRLLLKNKIKAYFLAAAVLIFAMWLFQYADFRHFINSIPEDVRPKPHHPQPLMPMPLLLDFTYSLLVIGANLAIALLFQRFEDKLQQESLTKANAENELAYLKAQINPHFYMNMLNNIHGMIEIDPGKAQAMVIDMSQLMRYMLYDSSQTRIPLANEISFLENYLRIMRRRYPENKVDIKYSFPDDNDAAGIDVPPLLTLVFVENAFKHGISYRSRSFVDVRMTIENGTLIFICINSCHSGDSKSENTGIGLRNIRQRLALIYGETASLTINESEKEYTVKLSVPINRASL